MSALMDSSTYSSQQHSQQSNQQNPHSNANSSHSNTSNSEFLEQQGSNQAYKALDDGFIEFATGSIGPFTGEWQGVARNKLIAERLSQLQSGDLEKTNIVTEGGGVRIHIGEISFTLTPDDVAAMSQNISFEAESTEENQNASSMAWLAAVDVLEKLGAKVPEKSLQQTRGELAVRQGRLTYLEGQALYGNGSWEVSGSNRGPLITTIKESNRLDGNDSFEWCGMYVGHAYKKAGIRDEIFKKLVFWSGYRLHRFFTLGLDAGHNKVGDFWEPHEHVYLHMANPTKRKEALDAFNPQPGDVALFRSDYSHVGMVDSYDPTTGVLEILEGNSGNRVQATSFGIGSEQITFLGRFNDSDYGGSVDQNLLQQKTPDVVHDDRRSGVTT